jgi:hypothetical protein
MVVSPAAAPFVAPAPSPATPVAVSTPVSSAVVAPTETVKNGHNSLARWLSEVDRKKNEFTPTLVSSSESDFFLKMPSQDPLPSLSKHSRLSEILSIASSPCFSI